MLNRFCCGALKKKKDCDFVPQFRSTSNNVINLINTLCCYEHVCHLINLFKGYMVAGRGFRLSMLCCLSGYVEKSTYKNINDRIID